MDFFNHGDALTRLIALILLFMSIASWVVMLRQFWWLARARRCATLLGGFLASHQS